MRTKILNGGIELGFLQAAEKDGLLSDEDKNRKEYLESLPKEVWLEIDETGFVKPLVICHHCDYEHALEDRITENIDGWDTSVCPACGGDPYIQKYP